MSELEEAIKLLKKYWHYIRAFVLALAGADYHIEEGKDC